MSDSVFVDTLFVVALINQRDNYHAKAQELSEQFEGQPLLTTDVVLLEIGNALARNFKAQAIQVLDDFFASGELELVHLTPELFERAYALYKQ